MTALGGRTRDVAYELLATCSRIAAPISRGNGPVTRVGELAHGLDKVRGHARSKGELRARAFGLMAQDADRPVRAASWLSAVRYARRNRCKGGETGEHCQNVGRQIRLARAGLLGPHPGAGVLQAAVRLGNGSLQAR